MKKIGFMFLFLFFTSYANEKDPLKQCPQAQEIYKFLNTSLSQQKEFGNDIVVSYISKKLEKQEKYMRRIGCEIPS